MQFLVVRDSRTSGVVNAGSSLEYSEAWWIKWPLQSQTTFYGNVSSLFECLFEFQRLTTLTLYISGNGLTPKSLEKVAGVVQSSVTWLRHQMEIFSALLALCAGNSPVPLNSPHKGQWRRALMFSLICAWINDWAHNREAGDLRRHRGHYNVNVMSNLINNHHHETRHYDNC